MFRTWTISLAALLLLISAGTSAHASYQEYTLSHTYNDLFGTSLSEKQVRKLGTGFSPYWSLNTMNNMKLMVMDTASTDDLYIKVWGRAGAFKFFDNTGWDGKTRGYGDEIEGSLGTIDLAETLNITDRNCFSLYVGDDLIYSQNARIFMAPDPSQGFLLGFNDNGHWKFGDGDLNEPLIYCNASPTPIPGAVWLLGTGLVGLIGLRRRQTA